MAFVWCTMSFKAAASVLPGFNKIILAMLYVL